MLEGEEAECFLDLCFLLCCDVVFFGEFGLTLLYWLGRCWGGGAPLWGLNGAISGAIRKIVEGMLPLFSSLSYY